MPPPERSKQPQAFSQSSWPPLHVKACRVFKLFASTLTFSSRFSFSRWINRYGCIPYPHSVRRSLTHTCIVVNSTRVHVSNERRDGQYSTTFAQRSRAQNADDCAVSHQNTWRRRWWKVGGEHVSVWPVVFDAPCRGCQYLGREYPQGLAKQKVVAFGLRAVSKSSVRCTKRLTGRHAVLPMVGRGSNIQTLAHTMSIKKRYVKQGMLLATCTHTTC